MSENIKTAENQELPKRQKQNKGLKPLWVPITLYDELVALKIHKNQAVYEVIVKLLKSWKNQNGTIMR